MGVQAIVREKRGHPLQLTLLNCQRTSNITLGANIC